MRNRNFLVSVLPLVASTVFVLAGCSPDPSFQVTEDPQATAQRKAEIQAQQQADADAVAAEGPTSTFECIQTADEHYCMDADGNVHKGVNPGPDGVWGTADDELEGATGDPQAGNGSGTGSTDTAGGGGTTSDGTGGSTGGTTGGTSGGTGGTGGGDTGGGGGTTPPTLAQGSDSFTQNVPSNLGLDVLVVVDNSGSMAEEQANLAPKLTKILDFAQQANWRLAVRTTDGSEAGVRLVMDKNDTSSSFDDKKLSLQNMIQSFGIYGSGNEQGIPMSVEGLKGNVPNTSTPWLRQDSFVAVLIVSDEDNCSNAAGCQGEKNYAPYLLNYLNKDSATSNIGRTLGETAKVYGLIKRNASECASAYYVGTEYLKAINGSGGIAGAICDSDYSATLSAISADLSVNLELSFQLAHIPIATSISVLVDGVAYAGSYLVNGSTIQLSTPPAAGSNIQIDYAYQVN